MRVRAIGPGARARVPRSVHPPRALRVRRATISRASSRGSAERRGRAPTTGRPALDIPAAVRIALEQAGVDGFRRLRRVHRRLARLLLVPARRRDRPPGDDRGACRERSADALGRRARAHRDAAAIAARTRSRRRSRLVAVTKTVGARSRRGRARGRRARPRREPRPGARREGDGARRRPTRRRAGTSSGGCSATRCAALAPHVALWQSVDRAELVDAIARHAPGARGARAGECGGRGAEGRVRAGGAPRRSSRTVATAACDVDGLMTVPPRRRRPASRVSRSCARLTDDARSPDVLDGNERRLRDRRSPRARPWSGSARAIFGPRPASPAARR